MTLQLGDWVLDADVNLTMELSGNQVKEHCTCGYCRNYYQAIEDFCPSLSSFLSAFGVNIQGPDELSPFEPTIYEASYIVQGRILSKGSMPISIDGIPLHICSHEESDLETEHPQPFFVLTLGLIQLPWVLKDPMDEVISPANEPEYLDRMQTKLLNRISKDQIYS